MIFAKQFNSEEISGILPLRKVLIFVSLNSNSKRIKAVKLADAVNKIEGAPVSDNARKLSAQWARGEIAGESMKAALISAHNRTLEPGHE